MANSWRTGNDLMPLYPSFMEVAEANSQWWQHAKPGHYNDPDDIALGFLFGPTEGTTRLPQTLSRAEAHLYFATWVMMRAPLILSADFARNEPDRGGSEWPSWLLPLVTNEVRANAGRGSHSKKRL